MDFAEYALTPLQPADPKAITSTEQEKILDWLAIDAQDEQWTTLSQRYAHNDLMSQYKLQSQIHSEKLKDANNVAWYLGVFKDALCWFIQMGIAYSNNEGIFDLL